MEHQGCVKYDNHEFLRAPVTFVPLANRLCSDSCCHVSSIHHTPLHSAMKSGRPNRRALNLSCWKRRLVLCSEQPSLGSWLFAKGSYMGCKPCFLRGSQSEWGQVKVERTRQRRMARFLSHELSLAHQENVAALTSCPHCISIAGATRFKRSVPCSKHFMKVLLARKQGGAFGRILHLGGRDKVAQIQFCLAEALRGLEREHLRRSDSLVFHADGRGNDQGDQGSC